MASEPELPVAGIIPSEWESITPLAPPSSHTSDSHQVSVNHYGFSNIPFDKIPLINDGLLNAVMHSRQLGIDRQRGALSSSCVTIFISDDEQQDASINIRIQRNAAFQMRRDLALETLTLS